MRFASFVGPYEPPRGAQKLRKGQGLEFLGLLKKKMKGGKQEEANPPPIGGRCLVWGTITNPLLVTTQNPKSVMIADVSCFNK